MASYVAPPDMPQRGRRGGSFSVGLPPRGISLLHPQFATFSTMPSVDGRRPLERVASWSTILPPAPEGIDERIWVMSHVCPPGAVDREPSSDGKVEGDQEEVINYWRAKGGDMLRSMGVPQKKVRGAGLL